MTPCWVMMTVTELLRQSALFVAGTDRETSVRLVHGHFGPKTFQHWCRSVHWTFRHHCKYISHFGRSVSDIFPHHLYFVHRSVTLIYLRKITLLMTYDTYFGSFYILHH